MKFSTVLPFAAGVLAQLETTSIDLGSATSALESAASATSAPESSLTSLDVSATSAPESSLTSLDVSATSALSSALESLSSATGDDSSSTTATEASTTDSSSASDASSTDTTSTDSSATETTSTESSSETVTTTTDGATDPTDISTTLPVVITTSTSAGLNTSSTTISPNGTTTSTSASSATTTTAAPLATLATFTLEIEGIIGLDGAIGAVRLGFFQFAIDFTASILALLEDGSVVDGAGLAFSVPSSRGLRRRQESAAGSRIFLIDPADADYETCVCSLSDTNELNCDCDGLTGFQVGTTDPYVGILGIGDVDADGFVDFIPVVVIDEDNTSTTTTGTAGGDATLTAPIYGSTGGAGAPSYSTEVVDQFTTYCPHPTTLTYASQTYVVTEATTLTVTNCPCTITKPVENGAVATHPAGGNAGNGGAANGGDAANGSGSASGSGAAPVYPAGGNNGGSGADQAPAAGSGNGAQTGAAGASGSGDSAVQQIGDGQIQNPANGGAASPAGGAGSPAGGAGSPAGDASPASGNAIQQIGDGQIQNPANGGAASPAGGAASPAGGAGSPAGGNSGASSSTPEAYQGAASSIQASFGFAVAMMAVAAF